MVRKRMAWTPKGFRRRRGICCVGAPRRYTRIACVAPPCIFPLRRSERGLLYFHHGLLAIIHSDNARLAEQKNRGH